MRENQDNGIKIMADYLRRGATMLDRACPKCGNPLFRFEKKTFCPSCRREVIYVNNEEEIDKITRRQERESAIASPQTSTLANNEAPRWDESELHNVLVTKLARLTRLVDNKTQLTSLPGLLDMIYKIVKILQILDEPKI